MNEKLQYASMLEIPVSTCSITYKSLKRKKPKKRIESEDVKKQLLDKVNESSETESAVTPVVTASETELNSTLKADEVSAVIPQKKKFKFTFATAELVLIGALVAVICLTNAFNPNSGINSFMGSVFSKSNTVVSAKDDRTFDDFAPVFSAEESALNLKDGVITVSETGSVYSLLDGMVSDITIDGNGKYSVEISHSDNFKTVISGLDYAYAELNGKVFGTIPVGYCSAESYSMCFCGENGEVIKGCSLSGTSVVWEA